MSEIRIGDQSGFTVQIDDIGGNSLERAQKLLAGIPGGLNKAALSALKRAGTSGEAYAARAVRKEYLVKASDFKEYTASKRHVTTDASGTEVSIEFRGYHIPLIRFDAAFGKDGRVSARVRRNAVRQTLDNAFTAQFKGKSGIYERVGAPRFPLRQFWGPATTQMMYSSEAVFDDIEQHIRDTFDKRLEHEVNRVLNGWGR